MELDVGQSSVREYDLRVYYPSLMRQRLDESSAANFSLLKEKSHALVCIYIYIFFRCLFQGQCQRCTLSVQQMLRKASPSRLLWFFTLAPRHQGLTSNCITR